LLARRADADDVTRSPQKVWQSAILAFSSHQAAAGKQPHQISRRVLILERFARDTGLGPWEQSLTGVRAWMDNFPPNQISERARWSAVRSFYRWAHANGQTFDNPTWAPDFTRHRFASEGWETEIASFKVALRAAGRADQTVKLRLAQITRFARHCSDTEPWDVTLDVIFDWLGTIPMAAATRASYTQGIRSFYQWAKATGRVQRDPTKRLLRVSVRQVRSRPAQDEHYAAALKIASPVPHLALRLAAELGLRRAELAGLHSTDLWGRSGEWVLSFRGKGDKYRSVPVTDSLADEIRQNESGYVFKGYYDGPISPDRIASLTNRLLPAGVTLHSLRHRFATKAYEVDHDLLAVQRLLGHSSPTTTQRYISVGDLNLRRTVDSVGNLALVYDI
jgi:integrase